MAKVAEEGGRVTLPSRRGCAPGATDPGTGGFESEVSESKVAQCVSHVFHSDSTVTDGEPRALAIGLKRDAAIDALHRLLRTARNQVGPDRQLVPCPEYRAVCTYP